jgi:hypothetical protein
VTQASHFAWDGLPQSDHSYCPDTPGFFLTVPETGFMRGSASSCPLSVIPSPEIFAAFAEFVSAH